MPSPELVRVLTLPTENPSQPEATPLLPSRKLKKPFYRARPLWLVPFALIASITRGMTLASRVEVFTQLACNTLHHQDHEWYGHTSIPAFHSTNKSMYMLHYAHLSLDPAGPQLAPVHFPAFMSEEDNDNEEEDPRQIPSSKCVSDPAVQAGAARLQTILTTTMGILSALTTGWWGHFGERYGRTRVLAIATCGLLLTDLAFILVSTPHSPLSTPSHKLLIIAPILEGLSGGTSALTSATTAYIADCTSPGSRARIFSRFSGVSFFGFALGPVLGAWLIAHPIFRNPSTVDGHPLQSVTCVFWVAITCSFVNLLLTVFVLPESLPAARRMNNAQGKTNRKAVASTGAPSTHSWVSYPLHILGQFLAPLRVFLPVSVPSGAGNGKTRKDWNLTFLALALFGSLLASGIFQIKYLYAEHIYEWTAGQLSYYISFMGAIRALNLLLILPFIITTFKPVRSNQTMVEPPTALYTSDTVSSSPVAGTSTTYNSTDNPEVTITSKDKKPKPTKNDLLQEMQFDLLLVRTSFFLDIISHTLVVVAPLPYSSSHTLLLRPGQQAGLGRFSEALFVGATSLSSLGAGVIPAVQSLALCMLQARALARQRAKIRDRVTVDAAHATAVQHDADEEEEDIEPGKLFGALAVLQAVGQTMFGPILFGLIYSTTVAWMPKAIFAAAVGILLVALPLTMAVRPDVSVGMIRKRTSTVVDVMQAEAGESAARSKSTGRKRAERRGRSRVSKDLRGGAASLA